MGVGKVWIAGLTGEDGFDISVGRGEEEDSPW